MSDQFNQAEGELSEKPSMPYDSFGKQEQI